MAWSIFAIFAAEACAFASWLPRLPELKALLGLSEGGLGLVLLALPAGALLVMPLAGWASTRLSVPRLNLLCLGWMMSAITAIGLVPVAAEAGGTAAFWLLPTVLFAVGLGSGAMGVAMNVAGANVENALRRPVLSRCHAMFSFGLAGGSLLAGAAAGADIPILGHLAIMNAVLFAGAIFAVRGLPRQRAENRPDARNGSHEGAPRLAWPKGVLLVPALVAFGCLLAEGAVLDWSAIVLTNVHGAGVGFAGAGLTAFALAMAMARLSGDWLSTRLGDGTLVASGAMLAATGYGAVALAPGPWSALVGFLVIGLGLAPIAPVAFRTGASSAPGAPGVGIAAVSTLGYAGFLLGPALVGLVAEAVGLRIAFATLATALGGVVILGFRLRGRPNTVRTLGAGNSQGH